MQERVLAAGLDARSLLIETSVLQRERQQLQELPGAEALIEDLARAGARLVVLGPRLSDLTLPEAIRRIRADPSLRRVSILAIVPAGEPPLLDGEAVEAGANAVLRRPLDALRLDTWLAKLLSVPRRVQARVPVQGHVVGTPRAGGGHFVGLTRNISVNGVLLVSPVELEGAPDVELEISLPEVGALRALGRVVRRAPEVIWPYLGYGVEFLFVPPESQDAIVRLVIQESERSAAPGPALSIRATLKREAWIYEILEPIEQGGVYQVEIRRAPREAWRPGTGGPFYVVAEASPEAALAAARAFVRRHG